MNNINIFQTAIWTVLFIVPGFLASSMKHYWMLTMSRRSSEKSLESIGWSFVLYYLLSLLSPKIFDMTRFSEIIKNGINNPEKLLFDFVFLKSYLFILIVAVILGFTYGRYLPTGVMSKFFSRTPFSRVWDEFFYINLQKAAKIGVWLEMNDGTQWVGKLKRVTDIPGSAEIWLTHLRKYENDTMCDTVFSDLLVSKENIKRIFILKPFKQHLDNIRKD